MVTILKKGFQNFFLIIFILLIVSPIVGWLTFALSSPALETASGFNCPEKGPADEFGQIDPHPKYSDPNDCAKFFICLNGISPREQGCELGLVYNELSAQCDAPENVPEWWVHFIL